MLMVMIALVLVPIAHFSLLPSTSDFNTLKSHRALKQWLKKQVEPYGIKITDLSSSWSSGLALCAIIHRFRPDLMYVDVDYMHSEVLCIMRGGSNGWGISGSCTSLHCCPT